MKNKLIPYLQKAINNTSSLNKPIISLAILNDFSFGFRHRLEHCDVIISYDSIGDCVLIKKIYSDKDSPSLIPYNKINLEEFENFLSSPSK